MIYNYFSLIQCIYQLHNLIHEKGLRKEGEFARKNIQPFHVLEIIDPPNIMGCDCDMKMKSVKNDCILLTQHNSPHPDTGQVMTLVLTQYLKNINLTDRMSDYIPGDH